MSLKITIPKPCHEDWNGMTRDEKGRFCSQCAKSVVDFTAMPRAEVEAYLTGNSDKGVCGRFTREQLHRTPKPGYAAKMALAGLLMSASATLNSCMMGVTHTKREKPSDDKTSEMVSDSLPAPDTEKTSHK